MFNGIIRQGRRRGRWRRRLTRLSACVMLTVDILSTFCTVFMAQCVKLIVRIFEFGFCCLTVLFIAKM